MSTQPIKVEGKELLIKFQDSSEVSAYPVDMSKFLVLSDCTFDGESVPYYRSSAEYHPTVIGQYALAHLNRYLETGEEYHRRLFLAQAHWFVEHQVVIGERSGGWLVSFPQPNIYTSGPWLSAVCQGYAISALVRAYKLTHEKAFLEVAYSAVDTFEQDILDGGICTPIGEDGIFFEEVAVYPAQHGLSGFIFALIGLYDYMALGDNDRIEKLVSHSLGTMHRLLDEFDLGFWTYSNLLSRQLASPSQLALQIELLEVLSRYSGCDHCSRLASRWQGYQYRFGSRLRYQISSHCRYYGRAIMRTVRTLLFHKSQPSRHLRICVPVPAHPFVGGILTVLNGVTQVTSNEWQLEYLTHTVLPNPEGLILHGFGIAKMGPWQFPNVWIYALTGCWKLISLMLHGGNYQIILPQDGVSTAAFAALAAKLAGVRVVCIDHSNLVLLKSRAYRAERIKILASRKWLRRRLSRFLYIGYWPSLYLLAWIAARCVDHYLIPGIVGDGTEEICQHLGIPLSRVTRFTSMIDTENHIIFDTESKARLREKNGIAANAIVIAIICRLAPEKGLDIALEAVNKGNYIGAQATGNGVPAKTAARAVSMGCPCLCMVER